MLKKVYVTARGTATNGRNGHTQSDDGLVSVDLSVPKAMGGPGKPNTTTPEHLFAAGYAACFGGACDYMAKQLKVPVQDIVISADVAIGEPQEGGFGLAVVLHATLKGVSQEDAQKIVEAAHGFCPYSKAIKGNVDVKLDVKTV